MRISRQNFAATLLVLLLVVGFLGCTGPNLSGSAQPSTARHVFLVRQTEREWEGENPPLTAVGEVRAQTLAAALRDSGITTIYDAVAPSRDTAAPLAKLLKLTPEVVASTTASRAKISKRLPTPAAPQG